MRTPCSATTVDGLKKIFDKIIQDLQTIGMGIATVNRQDDPTLFSKLKIHYVPSIIAVLDGKPSFIRGDIGVHEMREYIRKLFPRTLITKVSDKNYKSFLNGWHDNRVRVLFFSKHHQPSLRFVLMAYAYRERIAAGFVSTSASETSELKLVFNIQANIENLLFFNEDTAMPVASLKMHSIARSTMDELAESHKYLMLPRISSPSFFQDLCPPQTRRMDKKFCVVLVSRNNKEHRQSRSVFQQFAHNYSATSDKVQFAYIYEDSQSEFVNAVTKGKESSSPFLRVIFLWQNDEKKIIFDIIEKGWTLDNTDLNGVKKDLTSNLDGLLKTKPAQFPYKVSLPTITDEHANTIFVRMYLKLYEWSDVMVDYFWHIDPLATITVTCLLLVTIFMMYTAASIENEKIHGTQAAQERKTKKYQKKEMDIHPFNEDAYQNLVCNAKPGHITVMVLVEAETMNKVVNNFAKVVFPYSRSMYVSFAFLELEQYLQWYKYLLEETLDHQRELDINIKNCVGTVMMINGHRKYYSLYHPTVRVGSKNAVDGGDFLGMQDSDGSDEDNENVGYHDDIFSGLANWLDRMCEGSLKRLPVREWPKLSTVMSTDPVDKKNV